MTPQPIEPYPDDPHLGHKRVYACAVDQALVVMGSRPFPQGTIIVKESTRTHENEPWLIATARHRSGGWQWDEYTRNFPDEPYRRIPVAQEKCTGCHGDGRSRDPIFTRYAAP